MSWGGNRFQRASLGLLSIGVLFLSEGSIQFAIRPIFQKTIWEGFPSPSRQRA